MTCPKCHCRECRDWYQRAATAELNRVLRKHVEHHIDPINEEPDPDALQLARDIVGEMEGVG